MWIREMTDMQNGGEQSKETTCKKRASAKSGQVEESEYGDIVRNGTLRCSHVMTIPSMMRKCYITEQLRAETLRSAHHEP